MTNYLNFILEWGPLFLKGAFMTLKIAFFSVSISISIGTIFGLLTSHRLKIPFISKLIDFIAFTFRAIPFYVQLLIVYFVLPDLLGLSLSAFTASCLALGLCSSGFSTQIIRGGINSVATSQWESAYTLGYTPIQAFKYLIFPQVLNKILPMLNNELENLIKSTSITASIGLLELTRVGMNLMSTKLQPLEVYLTLALFYLIFSSIINFCFRFFERRSLCSS